jgi:hypothetical protein
MRSNGKNASRASHCRSARDRQSTHSERDDVALHVTAPPPHGGHDATGFFSGLPAFKSRHESLSSGQHWHAFNPTIVNVKQHG